MKRLLLVLAALTLAMPAFGIGGHHSALTEDGTYYSVSVSVLDMSTIPASTAIEVSAQRGEEITREIVPGSDAHGLNFEPSMYWDQASETLLVFWVRMPSMMSSEILFSALSNDGWSQPTSIDNGIFRFRKNLRIAATHRYQTADEEGKPTWIDGLAIHAVWWDDHGGGSDTQYAILGFDGGKVSSIERFSLPELIDRSEINPTILHPEFDRTFFQSPTITVHPASNAVEILFGDWDYNVIHKIELIPIFENGVLTIPNGLRNGDPFIPQYEYATATSATSSVELISGGFGSRQIAAYWRAGDAVVFTRFSNGTWSETRKVLLGDHLSESSAVLNLRRLLGRD